MFLLNLGESNFDELTLLANQCKKLNKKQYKKIELFGRMATFLITNTLKSESEEKKLTGNQITVVSLFIKILNRAESIILTTERGIEADAILLLRGLIEQIIMLKLCCDDDENYKIYVKKAFLAQKGTVNELLDKKIINIKIIYVI